MSLPLLYVVRHGDTAWTDSHQHTGRTDLPLEERGEAAAVALRQRLVGITVGHVFVSPLGRTCRTCELAGFSAGAVADPDLLEWDYGQYEGKLTTDIRAANPTWDLFRDGCPGGESPDDVAARADRFVAKVRAIDGNVMAFSHGHL